MEKTKAEKSQERSGYVAEYCQNCETEIEMRWDVDTLGYKAYCPVCGERLMLCDACRHNSDGEYVGGCDYGVTCYGGLRNTCKHNQEQNKEFEFILDFIRNEDFSVQACCSQLRALWTAYCLKHDMSVDTAKYDAILMMIWNKISNKQIHPVAWNDFEDFDGYMCEDMV